MWENESDTSKQYQCRWFFRPNQAFQVRRARHSLCYAVSPLVPASIVFSCVCARLRVCLSTRSCCVPLSALLDLACHGHGTH